VLAISQQVTGSPFGWKTPAEALDEFLAAQAA
jgi:hypothetical protein